MENKKPSYEKASQLTASDLLTAAKTISVQQLSRLSLPEVEAVVELISKVVPAGNVPGMILSGLSRLPGRRIPIQKMQQDVNALFSGVEQILDQAVYGGSCRPRRDHLGYQNLPAGWQRPRPAFPAGRGNTGLCVAGRHSPPRNETHGFDTLLRQNIFNWVQWIG